jgi:hypothetical protein
MIRSRKIRKTRDDWRKQEGRKDQKRDETKSGRIFGSSG